LYIPAPCCLPTAAVREINAEYTPQETKTTPYTVNLKVFGDSFQLGCVIIEHEKQVVDHVQFQLAQRIQATRALFHDLYTIGKFKHRILVLVIVNVVLHNIYCYCNVNQLIVRPGTGFISHF